MPASPPATWRVVEPCCSGRESDRLLHHKCERESECKPNAGYEEATATNCVDVHDERGTWRVCGAGLAVECRVRCMCVGSFIPVRSWEMVVRQQICWPSRPKHNGIKTKGVRITVL